MKCSSPRRIYKNLEITHPMGLLVPCGQCIQCRINRREEWTTRILHESLKWDRALFLTLTYSNENLPENESISKKELQNFFKRLRKNDNHKRKIKYYACGDYGEIQGRPHYHSIIFGFGNNKEDRELIKASWTKCDWSMLGKDPFGEVTPQSIRYVLSYIERVIVGKQEEYAYPNGIEKPFNLLSKGIGKDYAKENMDILTEDNFTSIKGIRRGIPRYYKKIIGVSNDASKEYFEQKEKEFVESICGLYMTRDELYLTGMTSEILRVEGKITEMQKQRDINIEAMMDHKERK